jgi:hypothetical protein
MHTWGEGGTLCTPSKYFEKLGHKNATKHKNMRPPSISSQPHVPPQNTFKMTVHLWNGLS